MKLWKWALNNFGLKVLALILAVITWFYVFNEIEATKPQPPSLVKVLPDYGSMVSRKLFVKAIFIGSLPEGYDLLVEKVLIDPPYFVVAAPRSVFNDVDKIETEPIEIDKFKKTHIYNARIKPIAPSIDTDRLTVRVTIPIKKIEQAQE